MKGNTPIHNIQFRGNKAEIINRINQFEFDDSVPMLLASVTCIDIDTIVSAIKRKHPTLSAFGVDYLRKVVTHRFNKDQSKFNTQAIDYYIDDVYTAHYLYLPEYHKD